MLPELERSNAQSLAMDAQMFAGELGNALATPATPTPDLTGWLIHAMPAIYDRAIFSSPHLRPDQASSICERFATEYAAIIRITSNAAGFSNPIKKMFFNAAFGRMFTKESTEIRAVARKLWDQARSERTDPLLFLSHALVAVAETKIGQRLSADEKVPAVRALLENRFSRTHALCR